MQYKQLAKYPHLGPEDAKIWDTFIQNNPEYFESVEYDLRVGEGRDYSEHPDDQYKADMIHLSKKRIDVVGFRLNEIYIIELKPNANMSAIGQVVGLTKLYQAENKTTRKIYPVIITDEILPDMANLCGQMGVLIYLA